MAVGHPQGETSDRERGPEHRYREPFFPLIQRYILWELLSPLIIGMALCTTLLMVQTVVARFDVILASGIETATLLQILLCLLPALIINTAFVALLFSLLLVYGRMSEEREFLAMMAAGVSYRHFLQPALFIGCGMTLLLYYAAHEIAPRSMLVQQTLLKNVLERIAQTSVNDGFNSRSDIDIYVRRRDDSWLNGIVLVQRPADKGPPGKPSTLVASAPTGRFVFQADSSLSRLQLFDGSLSFPTGSGYADVRFERFELSVDVAAGLRRLMSKLHHEQAFSTGELRRRIRLARSQTGNPDMEREAWRMGEILTERHTLPISCLIFALLGAPLGLWSGFGRKSLAFLGAFSICFLYLILYNGFKALAQDGVLPAMVALWIPNVLFGGIALWLNLMVRRR